MRKASERNKQEKENRFTLLASSVLSNGTEYVTEKALRKPTAFKNVNLLVVPSTRSLLPCQQITFTLLCTVKDHSQQKI